MADWRAELGNYEPLHRDELPDALGLLHDHLGPLAPMFPTDWVEMMALTFWSALLPHAKVENLGLNLWFLGINSQGVGKNITSDELYRTIQAVGVLQERRVTVYTSGSGEGMGRRLQGTGNSLLAYHAEYSGFLKSLRQMPGAKEMLCNLYDGRDVLHQLAQESIEVIDPYVCVVATTTMQGLADGGNREDLTNGYLSRFLFCAPDSLDVGQRGYRTERERYAVAAELVRLLAALGDFSHVTIGRGGELVLDGFRERLGLHTGRTRNLDEERHNQEPPAGRLLARVKKVAALLALAAGRVDADPADVGLAIRIVGRAAAYQRRAMGWLGAQKESSLSAEIERLLKKTKNGLRSRDIQITLREKAGDVNPLLDAWVAEGRVIQIPDGQSWKYLLK